MPSDQRGASTSGNAASMTKGGTSRHGGTRVANLRVVNSRFVRSMMFARAGQRFFGIGRCLGPQCES
jgi:hypothetical protein